jgi:hypothetical protein
LVGCAVDDPIERRRRRGRRRRPNQPGRKPRKPGWVAVDDVVGVDDPIGAVGNPPTEFSVDDLIGVQVAVDDPIGSTGFSVDDPIGAVGNPGARTAWCVKGQWGLHEIGAL